METEPATSKITPKHIWRRKFGDMLTQWEDASLDWHRSRTNKAGVIYMLTGDKHAVQLAVSIYSLRQHCPDMPITIITGDATAHGLARIICDDKRAKIDFLVECEFPTGEAGAPRGIQYANKTAMRDLTPYANTLFVDADTLFNGDPSSLLKWPETRDGSFSDSVTLTSFADWKSNGRKIAGRCEKWRAVCPDLVDYQQHNSCPAINTGVIRFSHGPRSEKFFRSWRALTMQNVGFICDEIAAQLLFLQHATEVVDHRWNYSPVYSPKAEKASPFTGTDRKPRIIHGYGGTAKPMIIHGHGGKFIRKQAGRDWWLPVYNEAMAANFGYVAQWAPAGDKNLAEFLDNTKF